MTRKQAVEELERLARDPNRQRLKEKFRLCPESRALSELLGASVLVRRGQRPRDRQDLLPFPPCRVHPG